jgi:hypothetical protein
MEVPGVVGGLSLKARWCGTPAELNALAAERLYGKEFALYLAELGIWHHKRDTHRQSKEKGVANASARA